MNSEKKLMLFMPFIGGGGVEKNLFIIANFFSKKFKNVSICTHSKKYKNKFNRKINFLTPTFYFSENILQLREKTVHAKALIEAYLDFPDEEDVNIDVSPAKEKINECLESLNNTLLKAKRGRMLNHAPLIVLAGPPNAGKSTLINYLSGSDTSIVSEHPGTTRDAIRESILLSDQLVTLVDTAGLRSTNDEVEKEGVERTYKAIHSADLVLYIFDSRDTGNPKTEIKKYLSDEINYMLIRNKIDLCDKKSMEFYAPDHHLCVDNATMIAWTGVEKLINGEKGSQLTSLPKPRWSLEDL